MFQQKVCVLFVILISYLKYFVLSKVNFVSGDDGVVFVAMSDKPYRVAVGGNFNIRYVSSNPSFDLGIVIVFFVSMSECSTSRLKVKCFSRFLFT